MFGVKFLKYSAVFASGICSYYLYNMKRVETNYQEIQSKSFVEQLVEGKYFVLDLHKKFLQITNQEQFLENLLLNNCNAFNFYQVYVSDELLKYSRQEKSEQVHQQKIDNAKISCIFSAKKKVQAHQDIVHGGFTATLIDNTFGYLASLLAGLQPVATANLSINYKKPIKIGKEYMLTCDLLEQEGKKIKLRAQIIDDQKVLHVEATSLMVQVNWKSSIWHTLFLEMFNQVIPFTVRKPTTQSA